MFKSARLKLTAWYLVIIMAVSLMFSLVIFRAVSSEVERFEKRQRLGFQRVLIREALPVPPPASDGPFRILLERNPDLLKEVRRRMLVLLGVVNGAILLAAGALGYWLAGRTLKPIQQMVEEQNRFISDASHELKTPLTSLKAAFEVHLRDARRTPKESDTLIEESIREVNKLQALSESLLQLAHLKKPINQVKLEPVALLPLVKRAVKKMKPQAQTKNIKFKVLGAGFTVLGNAESLEQLLVILLDNALKYSREGKTVEVGLAKKEKQAKILVVDQGVGIAEKDLPYIFERFYRADQARSNTYSGGFGLGLAIAKEIVVKHSGALNVQSKLGKGTTFVISLPLFS